MAITDFQRNLCRLIAGHRVKSGESYVAGGVALGVVLGTSRLSRDVDLFHNTQEALAFTWDSDRRLLEAHGYEIGIVRERPAFVEALIAKDRDQVLLQWTCDSAYRFFPLVEHPDFGLTLHPFDLATNKVLALVGRLGVCDWIDLIECHRHVQPLGYLVWAACGKDPGWSPENILNEARRSARSPQDEIEEFSFEGPPPSAADLAAAWKAGLDEAIAIHAMLPPETAGCCILGKSGMLFRGSLSELQENILQRNILFHHGTIRGAWPQIRSTKG